MSVNAQIKLAADRVAEAEVHLDAGDVDAAATAMIDAANHLSAIRAVVHAAVSASERSHVEQARYAMSAASATEDPAIRSIYLRLARIALNAAQRADREAER